MEEAKTCITTITGAITLGELLNLLGPFPTRRKTPTVKQLQEEMGEPIAIAERSAVYANGYAVYENDIGRTVLWVPSCVSFTYRFNPLEETEKGKGIEETITFPAGFLETQPWPLAVMLIGEHRIEANMMNRTGSRDGTKDDGIPDETVEDEDCYLEDFAWPDEQFGENPEIACLRKEALQRALGEMKPEERESFILYYKYGYKQREISEIVGVGRRAVGYRLSRAIEKAKKFAEPFPNRPLPRL